MHAWAAWRVYKIDAPGQRHGPTATFLERIFHKLLLNFTWWVNRKDADGHNVFQGGFLGLDNIGVFDRSAPLPVGGPPRAGRRHRVDGLVLRSTCWRIALELARENRVYEDVATKFFEHFLYIAGALNGVGLARARRSGTTRTSSSTTSSTSTRGSSSRSRSVRWSASSRCSPSRPSSRSSSRPLPGFARRMRWFLAQPAGAGLARVRRWEEPGDGRPPAPRARPRPSHEGAARANARPGRVPVRSRDPLDQRGPPRPPVRPRPGRSRHVVDYEPAESQTATFGGNSNWRGPIWFPINYLLIDALQRFDHYYGMDFRVPLPTGSDRLASIGEVADDLARRLETLFTRDETGRRPFRGPGDAAGARR